MVNTIYLKALIVDDEASGRENLRTMLTRYCPEVHIIAEASSVEDAYHALQMDSPDIVFLDIEMPRRNGFDLLALIEKPNFFTVFVTAYNQYALRALKANAVDYLLKPVELSELRAAIEKITLLSSARQSKNSSDNYALVLANLIATLKEQNTAKKTLPLATITIHHSKGFKIIDTHNIIHIKADSNYSELFLQDKKKLISAQPLKHFEEILDPNVFFRVHHSHIININYLDEYTTEEGGHVILKDGSRVEVSRRRATEFIQFIERGQYAKNSRL